MKNVLKNIFIIKPEPNMKQNDTIFNLLLNIESD